MKDWRYIEEQQIGTDYENFDEVQKYNERMSRLRDFNKEAEEIISAARLDGSQSLLDIGTGTGEIAMRLAPFCKHVYGADISDIMLKYARQQAGNRGIRNITFTPGGFLSYEHSGPPLDCIVSQLALHHLPDFWKMAALNKCCNILSKNGFFILRDIVFSVDMDRYERTFDYSVEDIGKTAGDDFKVSFARHIRQEYSTFDWIMEEMLYRAGFEIISADYGNLFMTFYVCRKI